MTQAYSNPDRENEPMTLPNIEIWSEHPVKLECLKCGEEYTLPESHATSCPECDGHVSSSSTKMKPVWWWWACFPGCLPDSDVNGPFDTEEEALADAQDI